MNIEELESRYNYKFSIFFKKLWSDAMLDWMGGHRRVFESNESWENTIYPKIKEKPPVLLHTGGFDFEMLRYDEMLSFKFNELVDTDRFEFIPFAKTEEGNIFAFYEGMVVCIWDDMNETEVLAKNFEDFIFRKMLEAVHDVDKDDLSADYSKESFEPYREDVLRDLESIRAYLKSEYVEILDELYHRDHVEDGLFSFTLLSSEELENIIHKYLSFPELNKIFEHEVL
jgi:hypothetical protein